MINCKSFFIDYNVERIRIGVVFRAHAMVGGRLDRAVNSVTVIKTRLRVYVNDADMNGIAITANFQRHPSKDTQPSRVETQSGRWNERRRGMPVDTKDEAGAAETSRLPRGHTWVCAWPDWNSSATED